MLTNQSYVGYFFQSQQSTQNWYYELVGTKMHSHTVSYVSITEAHFTLELKKKQFQANQDEIRDAVMIEVRIFCNE